MTTPKKAPRNSLQFTKRVLFNKSLSLKTRLVSLCQLIFGLFILTILFESAARAGLALSLPLAPAIIGIVVLFCVLIAVSCLPKPIEKASKPLLTYMSLFFLPAIVGIANYRGIIEAFPLAFILSIVVATLVSLSLTALIANYLMKTLDNSSATGDSSAPYQKPKQWPIA